MKTKEIIAKNINKIEKIIKEENSHKIYKHLEDSLELIRNYKYDHDLEILTSNIKYCVRDIDENYKENECDIYKDDRRECGCCTSCWINYIRKELR